ncbi:MAG: hypothetical protein PHC51_01510 [bacterium]|nr:hypothetical protein [bacterium]
MIQQPHNTIGGNTWLTDEAWSVIFNSLDEQKKSSKQFKHHYISLGKNHYQLTRTITNLGKTLKLDYELRSSPGETSQKVDFVPKCSQFPLTEKLLLVGADRAQELIDNQELFAGWSEISHSDTPEFVWATAEELGTEEIRAEEEKTVHSSARNPILDDDFDPYDDLGLPGGDMFFDSE